MFAKYLLQARRLRRPVGDPFVRWVNPDDPQVDVLLGMLLAGAVLRTGGRLGDIALYDLEIHDRYGELVQVFAVGVDPEAQS